MAITSKKVYVDIESKLIIPSCITGKKHYLYAHTRDDNADIFYFGVGTMFGNNYYRALDKYKRNLIWKRIVAKTSYTIFIIEESDNKKDILDREVQFISLMGRKCNKSGCLSNLTLGGEGMSGHKIVWTNEMKDKIRVANSKRGIKNSTREKLRVALKKRGIINQSKDVSKKER